AAFSPGSVLLPCSAVSAAFSPDGKVLALGGGKDGSITFWDMTGKKLRVLKQQKSGGVVYLGYSPDGKKLESHMWDPEDDSSGTAICLWEVATGKRVFQHNLSPTTQHTAFSPDRKTLALSSGEQTVDIWDVAADKKIRQHAWKDQEVAALTFSTDGKLL